MSAEINIGKPVGEKRIKKGLRQEDLAKIAGLSIDYIGKIERGERTPTLKNFVNLLNLLGASADDVLDDYLTDGYGYRLNSYVAKIKKLSNIDRERIFAIVDDIIKQ